MYKSIFLFLGGTVFGAAVVAFVLSPAGVSDQSASQSLSSSKDISTVGQTASGANTNPGGNVSVAAQHNAPASQTPALPGAVPALALGASNVVQPVREIAPPTAEQVEQFRTMQNNLHGAAYNPSAVLADLTKQSDKLTPEQRQKLTEEAMEMIKRGELKAEQFTQPGT